MAFGLPNPNDHPLAIQVGKAEGTEFRGPEPRGIEGREDGPMLQVPRSRQDSSDMGGAEDGGELPLPPGIRDMLQHPWLSKRGVIEKAQDTDGLIKEEPRDLPVLGQIVLVGTDVLRPQDIRWGMKVLRQFGHVPELATDR